jgi:hypothetical protein
LRGQRNSSGDHPREVRGGGTAARELVHEVLRLVIGFANHIFF